ncbi:Vesicular-fusion protein SEC18 [Seminavis robusta]|uniref:Vesicle-fusing ATPase n=1 Tax=Seminavis robusta TaxID=568900 RepID=A0A9N8H4Y8_9STRA|nr:Vesicular-fusion protein SEC18 [Seminavis robusta]|eukprot:Sro98_g050500.1 Vesicular-fusion protein SEC18 (464) ;mRNA; f:62892-64283
MKELKLEVSRLPQSRLALTNKAYVHPSALQGLVLGQQKPAPKHLEVLLNRHAVFHVEEKDGVPCHQIALNRLHRQYTQLCLGDQVSLKRLSCDVMKDLAAIAVSVRFLSQKKQRSFQPLLINTEELAATVKTTFEGQIFQPKQAIAVDYQGTLLELTIANISVDFFGRLVPTTNIHFQDQSNMAVLKFIDYKPSNFNLEEWGIFGLGAAINHVFRQAFASRLVRSSHIGSHAVHSMLLRGPIGCGKMLLVIKLAQALNAHYPYIIQDLSTTVLDELFSNAEKEQRKRKKGQLHIIAIDGIEWVREQRNLELLLRRAQQCHNVLVAVTTRQMDFESSSFHLVVDVGPPPDASARLKILRHYTAGLSEEALQRLPELAERCPNYTGAELEGLAKAAASYALARSHGKTSIEDPTKYDPKVTYSDFEKAMQDIEPRLKNAPVSSKTAVQLVANDHPPEDQEDWILV